MQISEAKNRKDFIEKEGLWYKIQRDERKVKYSLFSCKNCGRDFIADRKQLFCSHACQPFFDPAWRKGKKFPNEKGGVGHKRMTQHGYVAVYLPGYPSADKKGRVLEHRLVMEKRFKRRLLPNEHVHHINGIKNDNRLENLVVLTRDQHNHLHKSQEVKSRKRNPGGRFI